MNSSADVRRRPVWVRVTCALMIVALAVAALGCFGQFPITQIVYELNEDITDNAVAQSIVMWLLIPVYGVAFLVDAAFLNLIDFWTGEPLLEADAVHTDGTHQTALTFNEEGSAVTVTTTETGAVTAQFLSVEVAPGLFELRSSEGQVLGSVFRTVAGDLEMRDALGEVVGTLTASQIAQHRAAHAL
jgi:hypothetical protein